MTVDVRVAPEKALISAIKNSDNDIAVLVGSAISMAGPQDDRGVPGVSGVLDIIRDTVEAKNLVSDYDEYIEGCNDSQRYQKSFSFLADYTSPNTINEVIRKAVLKTANGVENIEASNLNALSNLQNNVDAWSIPSSTNSLCKILSSNNRFKGPILTPNFDPLISIGLSKLGGSVSRTVLHSDCNLNQHEPDGHHIIHFHGFWVNTDTLHTPEQLGFSRPKLKTSLANILKNKTLLVIGYGGWDDIFTEVLYELMNDDSANLDIIWCFFESDESTISTKYSGLLQSVAPAIHRRRFRAYGGINCHDFLSTLERELEVSGENERIKPQPAIDGELEKDVQLFRNDDVKVQQWKIFSEQAHSFIRDTERAQLIDILENNISSNIVVDWGLSKDEFINTLVSDKNSPYFNHNLFKLSLEGVKSKQELLSKIEDEFGYGLQTFINNLPKHNIIICLDDVETSLEKNELNRYFEELSSVITIISEYHANCKVLICSKKPIGHGIQYAEITALQEYDVKAYISNHSSFNGELNENLQESLFKISKGIPKLLDKYIEELEVLSISELLDSHYTPESHKASLNTTFPAEVIKRIDSLAFSEDNHSRISYELLKMLAITEYGDAFVNLKRANTKSTFRTSHVKELRALELIDTITLNRSFLEAKDSSIGDKLLILPTVVREYIYSQLSSEELYLYVKQLANVHLGNKWREGSLNLCPIAKELLKDNSKVTGSTYVILIHLLRSSVELDLGRDIKQVYSICISYSWYLSNNSKYRELLNFTDQVRSIALNSDKVDSITQLELYRGEALRMAKQPELAKDLFESCYENKENLTRGELERLLICMAFLFESSNESARAVQIAQELLELKPKEKGKVANAKLILLNNSEQVTLVQLKELHQEYSKNNSSSAGNVALRIADKEHELENKLYWLDKILKGKHEPYSKYRAIVRKGNLLIKHKMPLNFTGEELSILYGSYNYGFNQKMSAFFNPIHKVLWQFYTEKQNWFMLMQLFKHSSLYWRVFDEHETEKLYSDKVSKVVNRLLPDKERMSKVKYVTVRIKQISPSFGLDEI